MLVCECIYMCDVCDVFVCVYMPVCMCVCMRVFA